ncbi:hypothetical protein [Ekhidna sp. To15]|uniref:hypothetical protein n=1 Tax=Ekhidna sp. To15 TaxID=3395267 RepID=UPI003F52875F
MKSKKFAITLIIILSNLNAFGQNRGAFSEMDFLQGEWKFEAKSLLLDGSYQYQEFYSKVELIHNGLAHKDDFHFKDQNGNWVIYGSTIRSYDSKSGRWKMLWYNYNLSSITEMTGEFKDGKFYFNGKGTDEKGEYIEKIVFYNIEEDRYNWKNDKSYDGGNTWMKEFFSYTATRIK